MQQTSSIPYSRGWRRDRTPVWRAGEGHHAAATAKSPGKKPKDHGTGRVCARDACGTILNRYNRARFCIAHDVEAA